MNKIKQTPQNNYFERYPTIFSSDLSCGYIPGAPECQDCPDLRHCPKKYQAEQIEIFIKCMGQVGRH